MHQDTEVNTVAEVDEVGESVVTVPDARGRSVDSTPGRSLRRRLVRWGLIELVGYFLLATIATWPLAVRCTSALPLGTESVATVPLLNLWSVWWNADRAAHFYRGYWDAPIFHPTEGAFAFSEPMPTTVVVGPIVWLSGQRVLAYNVLLLTALALNGWAAFRLLRYLRLRWLVCVLAGGIIEMLPMVQAELGVLQLVPLFGILWTLHALCRFARRPRWSHSLVLGAAFAFTYLTCAYYGLFLSILLFISSVWLLGKRFREIGTWWRLTAGAGLALLLVSPVVAAQIKIIRAHDLRRDHDWMNRLSADLEHYVVTPRPQWLEPGRIALLRDRSRFHLSPGWLKIALALLGAGAGLASRRYRKWTAFCLTIAVAALVLSQGPKFTVFGWSPYAWLTGWYPGMAQVRSPFRFAMFVQLATGLLAALGLQRIVTGRRWQPWRRIVATCLGLLALIEIVPAPQRLYAVPALDAQRGWIEWLKRETVPDTTIAVIPLPDGTNVKAYEETALHMYWGTFHHRRMINGYSGFFPESFLETKSLLKDFPGSKSIERLRELGVGYCVVNRHAIPPVFVPKDELTRIFGDDAAQIDVYRIEALSRHPGRGQETETAGPRQDSSGEAS